MDDLLFHNKIYVNVTFKGLVAHYLKANIKPVDVYLGFNDTIVFVFNRNDSHYMTNGWLIETI